MGELDFSGREQLYYQLYNILFQNIISGKYPIGSLIPAESELMMVYHVSRATARRSMDLLSNHGLVRKRPGKGTEVISNTPNTSPKRVVRYTKINEVENVIAVKKVICNKFMKATEEIAKKLQINEGSDVFQLKRVRYADEEPFYVEINYFVKSFVPTIMNRDFSKESLRVFLRNTYNIEWQYAQQEIYSILADEELAQLLHITEGSPLIYIKRVSFDNDNIPREYVSSYYRADKYHLEIELAI